MGSRGPAPKSATVHQLHGNPSKKPNLSLLDEFQPEVEIPSCPSWCWKEAKKEWKRITPLLEDAGLIALIDRAALTLYCQAWAEYVWHNTRLTADKERAEKQRQEAEEKGEAWLGGDGTMVPTVNGNLIYSHHYVCGRRAAEQVNKFLDRFGMAPDVRSRVTPSNNRQLSLLPAEPGEGGWDQV